MARMWAWLPGNWGSIPRGHSARFGDRPACMQWVPVVIFSDVTRPGREAGHAVQSNVDVKNGWSYVAIPLYVYTVWCLNKSKDSLASSSSTY